MKTYLSTKKTAMSVAVAASFLSFAVNAAEVYNAQDVVVTASRVAQQLADVNMSVTVIT